MVIYSWVILKEIIANPQRRDEKLPSNAFYNTYLSPLLIAYSDLQAALFISSWTKLKCINDQFHRLRLDIWGQTFAQWKLQMIWIGEILQYHAAIHNAKVRVRRETMTDEMLPSKVHNFAQWRGSSQPCRRDAGWLLSRSHFWGCLYTTKGRWRSLLCDETTWFSLKHIMPAFCGMKLMLQSGEGKCDNPDCAKQI